MIRKFPRHKLVANWLEGLKRGEALRLYLSGSVKRVSSGESLRFFQTPLDYEEAEVALDDVADHINDILRNSEMSKFRFEPEEQLYVEDFDEDGDVIGNPITRGHLNDVDNDAAFYEFTVRSASSFAS